ncbi:TetR-like C-terminal domain-containing protein [Pseudoclavibacter soli]|uniref:TetR-like C-terminal domain-containing protein n=1 Tax=Pseudoclavibacter soli TaxID=452623 RepID=UPI0004127F7A|nr:TetR-like C-terminal domain-containing protein [Pseudoclavibacter soli]
MTEKPVRRRRQAVVDDVFDAVISLAALAPVELNVMAICREANITRTTFYRHWSDVDELLSAILSHQFVQPVTPDTNTVEGDLRELQAAEIAMFNDATFRALLPLLVSRVTQSSAAATTWEQGFIMPRRQSVRLILDRAVERGQIKPQDDYTPVYEALVGPLVVAVLFPQSRELTSTDVDRTVRAALSILG